MIRLFLVCVVIAAVAFVTVWAADHPGRVVLQWEAYRIETSVAVLIGAAAIVVALAIGAYQLWRFVSHGPRSFREARRRRREQRGYRALTRGLVAVAAGDAKGARRLARRADALLGDPPLTLLLSAQAAQLEGDGTAAKAYFEAMLERSETEFLGLRGLLVEATKAGDRTRALELARRAYRLRPETPWVLTTLIDLQTRAGAWIDAEATVATALKHRAIESAEATRRRAVLLLGRARDARAANDPRDALSFVRKAIALAPDLVPAIKLAAELQIETSRGAAARKTIAAAWALSPHRELGGLFLRSVEASAPAERVKHVEELIAANPDDVESHALGARAALDAQLWGAARRHLEAAVTKRPAARIYRLMAELEESEYDDREAARRWLLEASNAQPDPVWICDQCGVPVPDWPMHCPACGGFDAVVWRSPPGSPFGQPADTVAGGGLDAEHDGSPGVIEPGDAGETPAERAARMT